MNATFTPERGAATRLLGRVLQHPAADPHGAAQELLHGCFDVFGGRTGFVIITSRVAPNSSDPMDGWQVLAYHRVAAPEVHTAWDEWQAQGHILHDPYIRTSINTAGTHRILPQPASTEPGPTVANLLHRTNVELRLVAIHSLSGNIELHLGIDFHYGDPSPSDVLLSELQAMVDHLAPVTRRIAMALGIQEGKAPLSPRLQQTLCLLLSGGSEKEIAGELGLAASTVHQYVVALYRHFEVQSRAELMALWL